MPRRMVTAAAWAAFLAFWLAVITVLALAGTVLVVLAFGVVRWLTGTGD